jgi:hypothetical protein
MPIPAMHLLMQTDRRIFFILLTVHDDIRSPAKRTDRNIVQHPSKSITFFIFLPTYPTEQTDIAYNPLQKDESTARQINYH